MHRTKHIALSTKPNVAVVIAIEQMLDTIRWVTHVATLRHITAEDIGDIEWLAKECRRAILEAARALARRVPCDDDSSDDELHDE